MEENTRPAAVAGTFYPGEPEKLRAMIEKFLSNVKGKASGAPRGMVVPHAGYIYSGQVAAFGYKQLQEHRKGIERIILLGPSHYAPFFGVAEYGPGLTFGDSANLLTPTVGDSNTMIPESKAFMVNVVRKGV